MTFYIAVLFYLLKRVSRHVVGAGVLNILWCFVLLVSQASKFQWLIEPYKVVETPYQLDRDPNILANQMQVSKNSRSCKFKFIESK